MQFFFFSLTEQLQSYWNGYMNSFGLNGGRPQLKHLVAWL